MCPPPPPCWANEGAANASKIITKSPMYSFMFASGTIRVTAGRRVRFGLRKVGQGKRQCTDEWPLARSGEFLRPTRMRRAAARLHDVHRDALVRLRAHALI